MWKRLTLLLTLGYIATAVKTNLDTWHHECPYPVCTCHLTHLNNLPVFSLMRQTKTLMKTKHNVNEEHETQLHKNEVFEADDLQAEQVEDFPLLNTAMCVLGVGVEIQSLLFALPSKLQVLIILQSSDSGNITLEADHFSNLQDLIALEIHGFPHDSANKSGVISLQHDVFKQLQTLKYINLEHVHLHGQKEQNNKPPTPIPTTYLTNELPNSIPLIGQDNNNNNNQYQFSGPLDHQLTFLSEPGDSKILPYETYQTNQEYSTFFTFSGLSQLKILRIFHCNVKHLRWEIFDGLHNLEELSLEGNLLLFLPEFSFYGTPSLKYLCLSHNNLLDVKSTSLIGLLQLEQLDISYNKIFHLSESSLPPFPSLKSADFHHNPLEVIFPHTFDVMNVTEELYIGGYSAPLEIQLNSFHGLENILKLGMTNVLLKVLEKKHLVGMSKLKELKIQGKINTIAFDAFLEVNKLEVLVLKNCSVNQISMDAFYGLNDLIYLDLSNNFLELIPSGSFDQLNSLRELNLRNNRLTKLPIGLFSNSLQMIRLDKNPWHCTCRLGEWNPHVINKIKKKILNNPKCQFRFDKGSMCDLEPVYQYVYEKKTTPQCATPRKYKGWSIFHVLRKILRCEKKQMYTEKEFNLFKQLKHNKNVKYNKLQKIIKIKELEKMKKTENLGDGLNLTTSTKGPNLVNSSNYYEQNLELKDDARNELNLLNKSSSSFTEEGHFRSKIFTEDKVASNNIVRSKLTTTNKDGLGHDVLHDISSQATLIITEFYVPSTIKLSLEKPYKNIHSVENSLPPDDERKSQTNEKLKDKNRKISDKPTKNADFFDQEVMKASKLKVLKEKFKDKLYKTLHKEKLRNI